MATYLINPHSFTVLASQSASNTPASNLNNDYPNMVWKSTSATGAYVEIDLGSTLTWDFVGLVGATLFAADTIRIRATSSYSNLTTTPPYDQTFSVSGTANSDKNLAFHVPASARTNRYIRLDFTLSGNPNAFVQAARLVVGKRIEADGIDVGADFNFEDSSRIDDYRGIQIVDTFDVKQSWKFAVSNIKVPEFNTNWRTFLRSAAGKAVLFIPDTVNGMHSQESVFGRIQGQTNAGLMASDQYKVNLYIREV